MINKRLLSLALAGSMLLSLTGLAVAGIPDDVNSVASSASGNILIDPAGNGPTLASQGLTILVTVRDTSNAPIAAYPFQDIWADDIGNGDIALCEGGSVAALNTAVDGSTSITGSISGGGATQAGLQVYIAGNPLAGPALGINVNSPDINKDLQVTVSDLGFFADFFAASVGFAADYNFDGSVTVSDLGFFADSFGANCP